MKIVKMCISNIDAGNADEFLTIETWLSNASIVFEHAAEMERQADASAEDDGERSFTPYRIDVDYIDEKARSEDFIGDERELRETLKANW